MNRSPLEPISTPVPAPVSAGGHAGAKTAAAAPLALAALGIVYGDIGTSPLYAFKECLHGPYAAPTTEAGVLGVLSLMVWSLTMVVTVKYLFFIMRADNHGEGGILALLALVPPASRAPRSGGRSSAIVLLVLFGAALLYGDGVITPAISVLSAVEGLKDATGSTGPSERLVVPLTVGILLALFAVQKRGTEGIGRVFGPVMVVWFVAIGVLGARAAFARPDVLRALNPWYAVRFLYQGGPHGVLVLGAVVLCITGGEALYADMGHFGRGPIRLAWFTLVMPCLLLNYFGQGALVLSDPAAADSPFYGLVPHAGLYPMIALATVATVIASQALISGAFSLTRQAVQLGFCPRVTVVHTSSEHEGQIYIPEVNVALTVACITIVLAFGSSDKLAAAYGIAVTGTMGITSVVYYVVVTRTWGWRPSRALPLVAVFLAFDGAFFGANAVKIFEGGWVPILMGVIVFTVMLTWKTGRLRLAEKIRSDVTPLATFLEKLHAENPIRVPGTAVFMTADPTGTPLVLRHHLRHNRVLHEQVILLSVSSEPVPVVSPKRRIAITTLDDGFYLIRAHYGFMETPRVPALLEACALFELVVDPAEVTFYLGRENLLASTREGMARWRKALFAFLSRNSRSATAYFGLPPDRVVELGIQVEL